jgi:RNA polymerase-binding transcription factor DksA
VTVDADDVERDLSGVERALVRLDEGAYGVCEVCGRPIDDEVLSSAPLATRCPASRSAACAG